MDDDFVPIGDLADYLQQFTVDYDDGCEGYLNWFPEGTDGRGEYYYRLRFERDGSTIQSWFVTIAEDEIPQ